MIGVASASITRLQLQTKRQYLSSLTPPLSSCFTFGRDLLGLPPIMDMTSAGPCFFLEKMMTRHPLIDRATKAELLFNAPQKATHSQSSCRSRNTLIIATICCVLGHRSNRTIAKRRRRQSVGRSHVLLRSRRSSLSVAVPVP